MGQFWNRHFTLIAEKMRILDLFRRKGAPDGARADAESSSSTS